MKKIGIIGVKMKDIFLEQLKDAKSITEEELPKLKGRSLNSNYKVGDKRLWFLFQEIKNNGSFTINFDMKCVVEREIGFIEKNYKLIRVKNNIPILEMK